MELRAELTRISDVSVRQRDEMYALMCRYYEGMTRANFDADLDEKHWLIRIGAVATRELVGFSTQMLIDAPVRGQTAKVLFSGDTIVDHRFWNHNPLARTWGRFVMSLADKCSTSGQPLYWFLIAKGYRTYRFLPVFFREYYPSQHTATPAWAVEALQTLGTTKFPAAYDPTAGVIRASNQGCRLRPGVADVTVQRRRDPHVRFFETRNPGHREGDELCCIAPLARENFSQAARRVLGDETCASVGRP